VIASNRSVLNGSSSNDKFCNSRDSLTYKYTTAPFGSSFH